MIEEVKFAYSSLQKVFEKQSKTIQEQRNKQVEALKVLKTEKNEEEIKPVEVLFPTEIELMKLKMK